MSDQMKPLIFGASEGPLSRTQAEAAFELLFGYSLESCGVSFVCVLTACGVSEFGPPCTVPRVC